MEATSESIVSLSIPDQLASRDQFDAAMAKLLALLAGFIVLTGQGGLHQCSLYAVTFYAVDHCEGKLEISATRTALGSWRKNEPLKTKSPVR